MSEGYVDVPGGRVWYVIHGDGGEGIPLLCLHGGPGFPHDYLEELAQLADRRPVIFYDQLGCGRSDRPDDDSLWRVDRFVEELAAVRTALGLDRLHLFGSSWGGMLAMQYVLDRKPQLESLILASSPASMPRWAKECAELVAQLPDDARQEIERHEAEGWYGCPEYTAAVLLFDKRHVCRLDPWPPGLERAYAGVGMQVYTHMNGPTEFTVLGVLKEWDVTDRLGEISVPTLVASGEHDELRPAHAEEIARRIPDAELEIFPDASHLAFAEHPDSYRERVNEFLDRVEG